MRRFARCACCSSTSFSGQTLRRRASSLRTLSSSLAARGVEVEVLCGECGLCRRCKRRAQCGFERAEGHGLSSESGRLYPWQICASVFLPLVLCLGICARIDLAEAGCGRLDDYASFDLVAWHVHSNVAGVTALHLGAGRVPRHCRGSRAHSQRWIVGPCHRDVGRLLAQTCGWRDCAG